MCIKIKISKSCWILIQRTFSTGVCFSRCSSFSALSGEMEFGWLFWPIQDFETSCSYVPIDSIQSLLWEVQKHAFFSYWVQIIPHHWLPENRRSTEVVLSILTEVNNLLFPLSLPPSTHSFSTSVSCPILLDISLQCVSVCMFLFSLPRPLGS